MFAKIGLEVVHAELELSALQSADIDRFTQR